ncbi:hypothetical protein JCM33374_g1586 [Metschnikowia sp. JCM 33374]|nr:hypothetical protein JCM33374_g1586 [Metschnikowia sp. JCM 33374]
MICSPTSINLQGPGAFFNAPTIHFNLTVRQAETFMNWIKSYSLFRREKMLHRPPCDVAVKDVDTTIASEKYITPDSPGQDIFQCELSGSHEKNDGPGRNAGLKKCGCEAKVVMEFPPGYCHDMGSLNIYDYGDEIVKIAWTWDHNHAVKSPKYIKNSDLCDSTIEVFETQISEGWPWGEMSSFQQLNETDDLPRIFQYIQYYHVQKYIQKNMGTLASKHSELERSLYRWADDIRTDGSHAEFTRDCSLEKDDPKGEEKSNPNQCLDVWSFTCVSRWQSQVLERDGDELYLVSTANACGGVEKKEHTYLFKIFVKNSITDECCPVAFFMSNSRHQNLIYGFLKEVQSHSDVKPTRVFIDCDAAEKDAIQRIWPSTEVILCHGHLLSAFQENVPVTPATDMSPSELDQTTQKAQNDFNQILLCDSKPEGVKKMQIFLAKYKSIPQAIDCVKTQWIKTSAEHHGGTGFPINEFIKNFNNRLKEWFIDDRRQTRPDYLVHILYKNVEPHYHLQDMMLRQLKENPVAMKKSNEAKVAALSDEEVLKKVKHFRYDIYMIKSFSPRRKSYRVDLLKIFNDTGSCTCLYFEETSSVCKHILAVERWLRIHSDRHKEQDRQRKSRVNEIQPQKQIPQANLNSSTAKSLQPNPGVQRTFLNQHPIQMSPQESHWSVQSNDQAEPDAKFFCSGKSPNGKSLSNSNPSNGKFSDLKSPNVKSSNVKSSNDKSSNDKSSNDKSSNS